jgi:hypothetical protein
LSFSVPEFELFGGCALSTSAHLLITYYPILATYYLLLTTNSKNIPEIMPMFLAYIVQAGGE